MQIYYSKDTQQYYQIRASRKKQIFVLVSYILYCVEGDDLLNTQNVGVNHLAARMTYNKYIPKWPLRNQNKNAILDTVKKVCCTVKKASGIIDVKNIYTEFYIFLC